MKNSDDLNKSFQEEAGDEQLAELIKEAGETARARKKKVMKAHFQKIREAVAGTTNTSPSGKTL
ncbi:MAG: hypothetical protein U9N53_12250 [Bacteroidota bacterium]|nr:hypothetical protein [Bacteroidota bacterium]